MHSKKIIFLFVLFFAVVSTMFFADGNNNVVEVRVPQTVNQSEYEGVYYYPDSVSQNQKKDIGSKLFHTEGNLEIADTFLNSDSFFIGGNGDVITRQNLLPIMTFKDVFDKYTAGSTIVFSDYKQGIKDILNGVVELSAVSDIQAYTGIVFNNITLGAFIDSSVDSSLEIPSWPFEIIIDGNMIGKTYPTYQSTDTVLDASVSFGLLGGIKGDNYAITIGVGPYGALAYMDAYRHFEFESSDTVSGTVVIDSTIYSTLNLGSFNFDSLKDIATSGGWKADVSFVYGEEYPLFGVSVKDFAFTDSKINYYSDFDVNGSFYYDISSEPTYTIDYTKKLTWNKTEKTYRVKPTYAGFFNLKIADNIFIKAHGRYKEIAGFSYGGSIYTFLGDVVGLLFDLTADSKGFIYYTGGVGLHTGFGKLDLTVGVGSKGFDFNRITSPKVGITFSGNL